MLKLFYVCYFLTIGVAIPFVPPYLRKLGLSGQEVSAILMISPVLQLEVPIFWGWLSDRTRRPDRILRFLCLSACIASVPAIFVRSMPALWGVLFLQAFFTVSISSLADSLAVEKARQGVDYSRIRLWGSLSFMAICLVVGYWLDSRQVAHGDFLVPLLISAGLLLSFFATFGLKGQGERELPHMHDVKALLSDGRFRLLLAVAGIHWMCLSPYHGYFGILLQDRGFSATVTSYAFLVAVSAEILVFIAFSRLRQRMPLFPLYLLAFATSSVRWWLTSFTIYAWLIVVTQALHGLTYGLFWALTMVSIGLTVPPKLRATGQVLFAATLGLGSLIGLYATGLLYDSTGSARTAFSLAGVVEFVPLVCIIGLGRRFPFFRQV